MLRQWKLRASFDSLLSYSIRFRSVFVPTAQSLSKLSTVPVDVLIDEKGKIIETHDCKDTVDHLPIERRVEFAQGA